MVGTNRKGSEGESELIHDLDEKIIAGCKVEDIEKEMRVMDAIEAISLGTTSTTPLTSKASSNLGQGNNAPFIPPSSRGLYSASPQQPQGNSGT